ncbi:ABC transporter substrate-binding protein [Sinirhodobacter populi]|uniref:ABC transporter substrate-binding protein n=1 Tax=Paenirhodobacter populi TaxID=2306993 RepID=A0A443K3F7_9RHOB|nr:ABC transporter substrate-binding protein [Sinirhodobacter populi]RWR27282.1 ABC transporter substrate-binding protein [Sinirhodobacter populi]
MSRLPLTAGFIPLTDAAPLIIAREMGFAAAEGLDLILRPAPSWSRLRDDLAFGQVDAAHLLSPMPVAMTLGLGSVPLAVDVAQVMSVCGEMIGVSRAIADRMRANGHDFALDDPRSAGKALLASVRGPLRIGVPFPFSMHTELLFYWIETIAGMIPPELDIHTVPPPRMAEALAAGEIDAFSVGEPWGSIAVELGAGELLLPGSAIWSHAPDKVLAFRHESVQADSDLPARLMRAVWRAGAWLADPGNLLPAAEILAAPHHVGVRADILERSLFGRFVIAPSGETRVVRQFLDFGGLTPFPWRSQGEWIAARLARRHGLDPVMARKIGREVFRSDLYRRYLGPAGAQMPGASAKVEGALDETLELHTGQGKMSLARNRFFDGRVFDPDLP